MDIVKMLRDREALVNSGHINSDNDFAPLDLNELACDFANDADLTRIKLFSQALYVMLREIREGRLTYDDAQEEENSKWYSLRKWYELLGWPYEMRSIILNYSIYAAQNAVLWISQIK